MNEIMICADELSVGYKSPLIKNICFTVHAGEIMTLIGPNGSGKSTILKTLSGHLKKHGGAVFLNDRELDSMDQKEKAKKLSVLLTQRIHSDMMTCREVVETGRYPYTGYFGVLSDTDRKAVKDAMKTVEIEDLSETDFYSVSDGQRQRVMLARAICQEPEILILDEPTSYLDIYHKIKFLEILRKLAKSDGIAVILSMHELDLAKIISDHTLCVKNGEIVSSGKPKDIFKDDVICSLFGIPDELYNTYCK